MDIGPLVLYWTHTPKETTMDNLAQILQARATDRVASDMALCTALGITGPGFFASRTETGYLFIYANEDDFRAGIKEIYQSEEPISDAVWRAVSMLAWIEDYRIHSRQG